MGHLLWSGIVPPERGAPSSTSCSRRISGPGGASGRWRPTRPPSTRSATTTAPVWPHDTPLAAWGLARHGYTAEVRRIARALIEAAAHFDWSPPEVFVGYARDETPFPIAYPTAARPQAWAAGTPILLVRVLLGIEPDRERQRLISTVSDELPSWSTVCGSRAFGHTVGHGRCPSIAAMSRLPKVVMR